MRTVLAAIVAASLALPAGAQVPGMIPSFPDERPTDLPRRSPEPAVALARSLVIPGAGWFYLAGISRKPSDNVAGLLHLVTTVGGVALLVNGTRQGKRGTANFGAGMVLSSRLFDLWGVTDAAAARKAATGAH